MSKEKFCTYLRVSTKRQGSSGLGLEAQRKMCRDYIENKEGDLVKEFQDVESGTHRDRPGLQAALDYCKAQNCTLVIAKLDRLARDVEFTFAVLRRGVQIVFTDMLTVNTMVLGVFATVAQYERELIANRTKGSLGAIKDEIKKNGGHVSKSGRYIKKLGRDKGADLSAARASSGRTRAKQADDWRSSSALYLWVTNQMLKGKSRRAILAEALELYEKNPALYGTRQGKALCEGTLSRWANEIRL